VMMNDPKFLRVETLFPAFQRAGCRIAVITAKDKLRGLLGKGLELGAGKACSFSSEKSDKASLAENGIDRVNDLVGMAVPDVYSAGLSEFVFAAGVRIMERDRPQVMYLSTTDYIQHKHAPGTPVANDFYAMMDGYMAKLEALGCTIVLTADHGMNAKFGADGQPDVIYLQDVFDGWLGTDKARVILAGRPGPTSRQIAGYLDDAAVSDQATFTFAGRMNRPRSFTTSEASKTRIRLRQRPSLRYFAGNSSLCFFSLAFSCSSEHGINAGTTRISKALLRASPRDRGGSGCRVEARSLV